MMPLCHSDSQSPPHALRKYQTRAVENLMARVASNPLLVAPPGSGKTVMASEFARAIGKRPLWIAHRKELIDQGRDHLWKAGVKDAITTSIQKQMRRPLPDVGVIIVDEAHHVTKAGQYRKLFESNCIVVGITATPFRRDGAGLGGMFGSLVVACRPRELVDCGHLFAPVIYSHSAPDMNGVKKTAGDFNRLQAGERANRPKLIADIVETWKQRAQGMKTLGFAVNIAHSQALVGAFNAAGVPAIHIDGRTPKDAREEAWRALAANEAIVFNVGVATEGFDLPDLDCAIMARPTASLCLWLQMAGRIMRPEGSALILDHAGNATRHGSPLRHIEYTLEETKKQKTAPLGLRMCPNCYLMVPVGVWICPDCGADLSPATRARIRIEAGDLVPFVDREAVWNQLKDPRKYHKMFGHWPVVIDGRLIEPTNDNKRIIYKWLLEEAYRRQHKRGWASHKYRAIYGTWPARFVKKVRDEVLIERWKRRHGK